MARLETNVTRPAPVEIRLDGRSVQAYPGESLAVALLAEGQRRFRFSHTAAPRGPFCNMGVCFDCVVEVDGIRRRACMTAVSAGMDVRTGERP